MDLKKNIYRNSKYILEKIFSNPDIVKYSRKIVDAKAIKLSM